MTKNTTLLVALFLVLPFFQLIAERKSDADWIGAPHVIRKNARISKDLDQILGSNTVIQNSAFASLDVIDGVAHIAAEFKHPDEIKDVRLDWLLYGWNQGWDSKTLLTGSIGITSTYQMVVSSSVSVNPYDYYLLLGLNKIQDSNGNWVPIIRSESRFSKIAPYNGIWERTGEVTSDSAVLHTYLTEKPAYQATANGSLAVPPMAGDVKFAVYQDEASTQLIAESGYFPVDDYVQIDSTWSRTNYNFRWMVTGLEPNTTYYYRVETRSSDGLDHRIASNVNSFTTTPRLQVGDPISFVVANCLDPYNTVYTDTLQAELNGLKTFASMLTYDSVPPAFIIMAGDTVYYDGGAYAPDIGNFPYYSYERMWLYWYAQYQYANLLHFFQKVPGYWMVDDHDYWENNINRRVPDGWHIFRNVNPTPGVYGTTSEPTESYYENDERASYGDGTNFWRSIRWGQHLEIFIEEGRHHREEDSGLIWGETQRVWLEDRVKNSGATFKIIVATTPLLGPIPPDDYDPSVKPDKHASDQFRAETELFLTHIKDVENVYIIAGDRHFKYHSTINAENYPELSHFNEFGPGSAAAPPHAAMGGNTISEWADFIYSDGYNGPGASAGYLRVEIIPQESVTEITFKLIRVTANSDNEVVYQTSFIVEKNAVYLPLISASK